MPEEKHTVIWKYPINLKNVDGNEFKFELTEEAEIVQVAMQDTQPCMWVWLDPEAPKKVRCFKICMTGQKLGADLKYVGTFQPFPDGSLVIHLLEDRFYGLSEEERAEKRLKEAIKTNLGLF